MSRSRILVRCLSIAMLVMSASWHVHVVAAPHAEAVMAAVKGP